MTMRAEVVVIGGGIMGLCIAYHLARMGTKNVVVLEKSYLCGGASGRNGGGIRAQWSSEANVRLMQESIRLCREFASEMKINVWFRQGGYLFLARSEAMRRSLEASVRLQNDCGLGTRMLTPREAKKIVPELDTADIVACSYNADDGVVFPWPFVWGYADAAQRLGVVVAPFTRVVGFDTSGSRIEAVRASPPTARRRAPRRARAGPPCSGRSRRARWSTPRARGRPRSRRCSASICQRAAPPRDLPSEPLKPWLKPLVADLSDGLYFSQSTRGEIVGGIGQERVPPGLNQDSSFAFLGRYARSLVHTCPVLSRVKVLRQWAGCYDLTPDANPIVGPVDDVEHFYQASGFMGHGFMMAPIVGKLIAQYMVEGTPLPMFERWNLRRFKEGKLLSESMILG